MQLQVQVHHMVVLRSMMLDMTHSSQGLHSRGYLDYGGLMEQEYGPGPGPGLGLGLGLGL